MRGIAVAVSAVVLLSGAVLAQETALEGKIRRGPEVVVPAGETVPHDLYACGQTVRVDGRVDGDLVAAGGEVDVAGEVTGDVLVAGGTVTIGGDVGGDVRVAGGQVLVTGPVAEDLLVAAGRARLTPEARVGEDVIFQTGQMALDGTVAGDVLGSTGGYQRQGRVAGSEQVDIRQAAKEKRPPTAGERILDRLQRYGGLLVVGLLLLWLAPRALRGTADVVRRRPLPSFGVGLLGVIGFAVLVLAVIVVTVLVAVVLGLLGLGLLAGTAVFAGAVAVAVSAFLFFVAVCFVAQAVIGLFLGRLLLRGDSPSFGRGLAALALGLAVVVLISAIPLVGGVLEFLLVLFGLGALLLVALDRRRGRPAEQAVA